jgi:hypothetical protein
MQEELMQIKAQEERGFLELKAMIAKEDTFNKFAGLPLEVHTLRQELLMVQEEQLRKKYTATLETQLANAQNGVQEAIQRVKDKQQKQVTGKPS